jgi:hypothetical protein
MVSVLQLAWKINCCGPDPWIEVDRIGPVALGVLLLGLASRVEFACGEAAVGMLEYSHRIAAMDALVGRMGAYLCTSPYSHDCPETACSGGETERRFYNRA